MFWKFIGLLVRLIYFKRFRQADRLGRAARLCGEGQPAQALRLIDAERPGLHPQLGQLFHAVRARTLEALGRPDEAFLEYAAAAAADPLSARAQLDLALSEANQGRLAQALPRLEKLAADPEADVALREVAKEALARLPKGPTESVGQNQ